jgi:hypothetical protein
VVLLELSVVCVDFSPLTDDQGTATWRSAQVRLIFRATYLFLINRIDGWKDLKLS